MYQNPDGLALPVKTCTVDQAKVSAAENGDISAMSVEEYMSWVQTQASSLPGGVRMDTGNENEKGVPSADVEEWRSGKDLSRFTGHPKWKRCVLRDFRDLRQVGRVWCVLLCPPIAHIVACLRLLCHRM